MSVAVWHRDEPLPRLDALRGLMVGRIEDATELARVQSRTEALVAERFAAGHRAYVARLDGAIVAWGWVATRRARIGELALEFDVPAGERYLWNFATLPAYRGRGIYPALLQQVLRQEAADAERFWIVYAPENHASAAGIRRAGFRAAAELSFDVEGQPALRTHEGIRQPLAFAPRRDDVLAPCWRCARAGHVWLVSCAPGACHCDYQRPAQGCARSA
ncbi:MAG TPA: GNAT family N-acetyltransferase [Gemmatimonadaceae bacterium]|nr:GNAT family N-acetyltransferase [Gemmatimonadaceae bacterium]HRQ77099.1 GNAT family N-acetyltransferase [Gemmatimonadaceae bacterium]